MKESPPKNKATLKTEKHTKPWWKELTQVVLFDTAAKIANDTGDEETAAINEENKQKGGTYKPHKVPDHSDTLPPEKPTRVRRTKDQIEIDNIWEEAKRIKELRK